MPSPFPGMDPYLEGQVYRDFHSRCIDEIASTLQPLLLPHYVALIEERVYLERQPEAPFRAVSPDVAVMRDWARIQARDPHTAASREGSTAVMVKPVTIPIVVPEETTQTYIEVRQGETHELVSVIELLSPTNKSTRSDGYGEYLAKREQILRSRVHLVEIDLLRGGQRMPMRETLPPADYYVVLSRSSDRPLSQVWPITLRDRLPEIPIPLLGADAPVSLDLQHCMNETYDRACYGSFLDYRHGARPPLSRDDALWAESILASRP